VNEVKLAKVIQAEPAPASEERIRAAGSEPGFASPMGLDISKWRLVVDDTVRTSNNLVTGANEVDYHYKNFNLERDVPGVETVDVIEMQEGDMSPDGGQELVFKRGIEVGNIFQLGKKYTESMEMRYDDESGTPCVPIMGCYGIGVGRLMSSVMEVRRDKFGPKWPISIAPWQVHLNALKITAPAVKETAEKLYADLWAAGVEVLYDDRDARPGFQFADADLLGLPFRIIVSERNLKSGELEWKRRDTGETGMAPVTDAVATIKGWVSDALAEIDAQANVY
jgi:prolyl-tRNA synthetase